MGPRVAGRRRRVALAAGLLATFVGCSDEMKLKGDPTVKAEQGKTIEESVKKSPGRAGQGKHDLAPNTRKSAGPE